jgi:hypothetical protein
MITGKGLIVDSGNEEEAKCAWRGSDESVEKLTCTECWLCIDEFIHGCIVCNASHQGPAA